jgi:hypothetical protein
MGVGTGYLSGLNKDTHYLDQGALGLNKDTHYVEPGRLVCCKQQSKIVATDL